MWIMLQWLKLSKNKQAHSLKTSLISFKKILLFDWEIFIYLAIIPNIVFILMFFIFNSW